MFDFVVFNVALGFFIIALHLKSGVKVFKPDSPAEIVGHLPMEISRITKFIIDRGAQVAVKIRGRHYRRSPLVQGGLEVPCEIKITMVGSIINHHLL